MSRIKTYRFRLTAYTIVLIVFLVSILGYTYFYARKVILNESFLSLSNTVQLLKANLEIEERELLHYAEIVSEDLRIQEYMFMVVKVGTDNEPLQDLYQRHFGWLPIDHRLIVTNTGRILLGDEFPELAMAVLARLEKSKEEIFFLPSEQGLEMVSWAPVNYRNSRLGFVAMVHTIDATWLEQHRLMSGGNLFVESNNIIQLSNIEHLQGQTLKPSDDHQVTLNNMTYRVDSIELISSSNNAPRLWYGVSERDLLEKLSQLSRLVFVLTFSGGLAIIWLGVVIVRNFSQPLTELIDIARSVAEGNLPILKTSDAQNEFDLLSNQFAEMLQALREKQQEVEQAHHELQQSAITDTLTGLNNRRYLQETFPKLLGQSHRESTYLSGILMDIDHFKQINDKYGHLAGDDCLIHFAGLLKELCRANDYVFRIGGEEFLLLSLSDGEDGGRLLSEKIRIGQEKRPARYENQIIPMTVSIGVSQANTKRPANDALTELLFECDKALYQAKAGGRNRVKVYHSASPDSKNAWDFVS